jgi:hypothetical protein
MTAIPHAALALTSALDRFGHASARVLEAVTGADDRDLGAALVEMTEAKMQAKAEMYEALLQIGQESQRR